jgi:anti-sigma B factor antagonist
MVEPTVRVDLSESPPGARLVGELDLSTAEQTAAELGPLFGASGDVVLDVSELTFIDSSGIRLLLQLHHALEDRGTLVLRSPARHVANVLEIAGLPRLGIRLESS